MTTYRVEYNNNQEDPTMIDVEADFEEEAIAKQRMSNFVDRLSRLCGHNYMAETFAQLHQILTDKTGAQQKLLVEMLEWWHQTDQDENILDTYGPKPGRYKNPKWSLTDLPQKLRERFETRSIHSWHEPE